MESYFAGLFDGDASICIGKCRNDGFQLKVEFSQCDTIISEYITPYFTKKYVDNRDEKYTKLNCTGYRACGKNSKCVLELMFRYAIIKVPQAKTGLEYLPLIGIHGEEHKVIRKSYYDKMKSLNKDKSYHKPFERLNEQYIAGLFDAEGCVSICFSKTGKRRWYFQIVQQTDPKILDHITIFLGYGTQSAGYGRWRVASKKNFLDFEKRIGPYLIIKKPDLNRHKEELFPEINQENK